MTNIRSKGFSIVEALVIVLVIAALGFGGWYAWHKHNRPAKQSGNTASENGGKQTDKGQNTQPTVEYLSIKEWGVRITVPSELHGDISYFVNDRANRDFGGSVTIDFLSKKFSAGSLKCAVVEGDTPRTLVSIYRENAGGGPAAFKTIGDWRYYFVSTTGCQEAINKDGAPQDKQLITSLNAAVSNTLEAAPEGGN